MNVPTNEQMMRAQAAAAAQVAAMSVVSATSSGGGNHHGNGSGRGSGGEAEGKAAVSVANPLGPFFQQAAASMAAGFHPQGPQVSFPSSQSVWFCLKTILIEYIRAYETYKRSTFDNKYIRLTQRLTGTILSTLRRTSVSLFSQQLG